MAKIADRVEALGKTVTDVYQKIENGVVSGYKTVEKGAVEGFTRLSDKCVDVLFAKEGETVEQAKARLRGE